MPQKLQINSYDINFVLSVSNEEFDLKYDHWASVVTIKQNYFNSKL